MMNFMNFIYFPPGYNCSLFYMRVASFLFEKDQYMLLYCRGWYKVFENHKENVSYLNVDFAMKKCVTNCPNI